MTTSSPHQLHQEGINLFRRGNIDDAQKKLAQALEHVGEDTRKAAEIHNDLGVIYKQLEDYPAAHHALDEALSLFEKLDDKKGQAQTFGNRAAVLEAEGRLEEAVDLYKQSANLLEELGESEMAMYAWQAVSKLRTKQGQYIAAIGAYEEGVSNMPKRSFKRKVLEQILKAPGSLLGGAGKSEDTDDDEDEDKK
jgi:tetratricopeptide (TPR) repeat protein